MTRREAVDRLKIFLRDECGINVKDFLLKDLSIDILNFLEKNIGMTPPSEKKPKPSINTWEN